MRESGLKSQVLMAEDLKHNQYKCILFPSHPKWFVVSVLHSNSCTLGWEIYSACFNIRGRVCDSLCERVEMMLVTIPPLVVVGALLTLIITKATSRGQNAYAQAGDVVEQAIGAIRTVSTLYS